MAALSSGDSFDYEEQNDELITGEAVALDLRPAGFILRAGGAAIDFIVYFGGYFLGLFILFSAGFSAGLDEAMLQAISIVGLVLFILVIPVTVEVLSRGKSLGKLAVGARIVRDDGGAIQPRHAFVRSLTGVVEIVFTLGSIAAVVGLLNRRSKRLGDLLAGTVSQHERVPDPPRVEFGVPEPLAVWAATADVARLPDGLSRRIASFLAQAPKLVPDSRLRLARSLAAEAAPFVAPLPQTDAESFVAAVAVLRRQREARALALEADRFERLRPQLTGNPNAFPER